MINYTPILAAGDDLMSHVLPHRLMETPLFSIGGVDFYLTNHNLMMMLAATLMLIIFTYVGKKVKTQGSGVQAYITQGKLAQFFETICVFLRDEVAKPALGDITDKYIRYIWTTFFFVLFLNVLGMIPIGPIARFAAGNDPAWGHLGGTATGNINITAALAIISFFMIHFVGVKEQGIKYFAHFNPGPWWMAPMLVPLELMGALVKPFALAVRLFANMVAGHLVLAALIGLIFMFKAIAVVPSLLGAAALSLLELFVAFLQAYIFTFLTILFIASGAVHEHEEHDEEHAVAAGD